MKTLNDYRETNLFDDLQMFEIERGLEEGLDVSIYTDPKFNGNQMFEIRWGLKRGVDVSVYADPKFHRCQMEEIREANQKRFLKWWLKKKNLN